MALYRTSPSSPQQSYDQLVATIFNGCFSQSFNTIVVGGADEPLYTPMTIEEPAKIYYRHDYESSLMHEVAHWCVAGKRRRKLEDYGYWYEPDTRTVEQQLKFQSVEVRPQAVEWYLSVAAKIPFSVSLDNPGLDIDTKGFKDAVYEELQSIVAGNVPPRAKEFAVALSQSLGGTLLVNQAQFCRTTLDKFKVEQ